MDRDRRRDDPPPDPPRRRVRRTRGRGSPAQCGDDRGADPRGRLAALPELAGAGRRASRSTSTAASSTRSASRIPRSSSGCAGSRTTRRRARPRPALVHGDFRNGNFIVGPEGIRAVLDWELAHLGDPVEDLGWLLREVVALRQRRPAASVASATVDELLAAYADAGGGDRRPRAPALLGDVRHAEVGRRSARSSASRHLNGLVRSVELATLGRRVAETEWDLLELLARRVRVADRRSATGRMHAPSLHDRPTAAELLEAVREFLERDVMAATEGRVAFHARVAVNVLGHGRTRARRSGRALDADGARAARRAARPRRHRPRSSTESLAAGIRDGSLDDRLDEAVADASRATVAGEARGREPAATCRSLRSLAMRIATWNVNSLKARLPRVEEWLDYAGPTCCASRRRSSPTSTSRSWRSPALGYESRAPRARPVERRRDPLAGRHRRRHDRVRRRARRPVRGRRPRSSRRRAAASASSASTCRTAARSAPSSTTASSCGSTCCTTGSTATVLTRRPARGARRLQRRARGPRRLVAEGVRRRDARDRARARRGRRSSRSGASSTRSAASTRRRPALQLLGLPRAATSTSTAACASTSCS